MEDREKWMEKHISPLTRGLERAYDDLIKHHEKELKRSGFLSKG